MSYLFEQKNVKLSYFPNEAFTFNYNDKRGVELELDLGRRNRRRRRNKNEKPIQQPNSFKRKERQYNNYFSF
jgi:hypothetical protein